MRYLFLFLFLGGMFFSANAQQKRNAVYVEALGNGFIYSVNYEHQILANRNLGVKVGVMYFNGGDGVVMLPIHLRYVFGQKHGLEIAGGMTYQYRINKGSSPESIVAPSGALMYRFQAHNGLLLRAGLAPTFTKYEKSDYFSSAYLYFWPGASIGYAF